MNNPLNIYRNAPTQIIWTVTLPPGQTLAGKNLIFTAKASPQVANSDNLFQKSSPSDGITITGDFTAEMQIDAADTSSLANFSALTFAWNLVLVDGSDNYPVAIGALIVNGNPIQAIP